MNKDLEESLKGNYKGYKQVWHYRNQTERIRQHYHFLPKKEDDKVLLTTPIKYYTR